MPGVEPGTSSLSGTRSNQLSYTPKREIRISNIEIRNMRFEFRISYIEFPARGAGGGGKGVRTPDPELAKLVLFQLSYAPSKRAAIRMTYAVFGPEAARRAGACDELPWVAPSEGRLRPLSRAGAIVLSSSFISNFDIRISKCRTRILLRKEVIQPQVPSKNHPP